MKKPNIPPGEWSIGQDFSNGIIDTLEAYPIVTKDEDGEEWDIAAIWKDCIGDTSENANVVITAGNLTNKGFNIRAIEEMYEVLQDTLECLINIGCTDESEAVKNIKQALKNAKYE